MSHATFDRTDFVPPSDPLLRDPVLACVVDATVLGHAMRFQTNSRRAATVVMQSFGCTTLGETGGDVRAPLSVRIVVHDGEERGVDPANGHAPVRHLCPDALRIIAHSPGSVAISDPMRGEVVMYVTTALLADTAHFRDAMLEAMTLSLLTHFDRHPLHAAAIARDDRVVLLAGPSGSGKSTLTYMAHRNGIAVLGDDHVWLQLQPRLAVWGRPTRVRLLPQARETFPELAGHATSCAAGKEKLDVPLGAGDAVAPHHRVSVCVLERGASAARLHRLSPDGVADALSHRVDPGFDRYPERLATVVHALAARSGWRLELSGDPRDALPLLRRMLDDA